jgi:hypothetical protein
LNGPLASFCSSEPFSTGFIGVPDGTGQVVGSAVLYRNAPSGALRWKVTELVVAVIPGRVLDFPSR